MNILHNAGQNIADKLLGLSKTGFSVKYYRIDFVQFASRTVKIGVLDDHLGTFL